MEQNRRWLDWAVELQSLAQAGLTYGKDEYDLERCQRIRDISASRYFALSELPEQIKMCFEAYGADNWTTLFD